MSETAVIAAPAEERVRAEAIGIPGWTAEHPIPQPSDPAPHVPSPEPPPDAGTGTGSYTTTYEAALHAVPRVRSIRPRTIRAWLRAGFGTNLLLLAAAGAIGVGGLRAANARSTVALTEMREHHETVQQVGAAVLREILVGSRYAETGDPAYQRRYQQAMEEADGIRRRAMSLHGLSVPERAQLETIGRRQSATEARLAMVRAYHTLGRTPDADRVLAEAMEEVSLIGRDLSLLQRIAAQRADERASAMGDALLAEELKLAALLAVALGVASIFALSTSTAVTRPLGALREEMRAIGAGDLREAPDRAGDGDADHTAARDLKTWIVQDAPSVEYAQLGFAVDRARERLRTLLGRVQEETDRVTGAARELAQNAGATAVSTQHVTGAVLEISNGASVQLDALHSASAAMEQLAEQGAAIAEAAEGSERAGREIRQTATATRGEIARAVDALLGAREVARTTPRARWPPSGRRRRSSTTSCRSSARSRRRRTCWRSTRPSRRRAPARRAAASRSSPRRSARSPSRAPPPPTRSPRTCGASASASRARPPRRETGAARLRDAELVAGGASRALARIEESVARVEDASGARVDLLRSRTAARSRPPSTR